MRKIKLIIINFIYNLLLYSLIIKLKKSNNKTRITRMLFSKVFAKRY